MSQLCNCYQFTLDEGTRVYTFVEMVLGVQNLLLGSIYAIEAHNVIPEKKDVEEEREKEKMWKDVLTCVSTGLILQGICSFALHFIGYHHRNRPCCFVWIILAVYNLICYTLTVYVVIHYEMNWHVLVRMFHIVYNILGIYLVFSYSSYATPSMRRVKPQSSSEEETVIPPQSGTTSEVTATVTETESDIIRKLYYPPALPTPTPPEPDPVHVHHEHEHEHHEHGHEHEHHEDHHHDDHRADHHHPKRKRKRGSNMR